MKNCAMKMKGELEKNEACVSVLMERKTEFISHVGKGHVMDINELQVKDS